MKKLKRKKPKKSHEATITMRAVIGQFSESYSTIPPARNGDYATDSENTFVAYRKRTKKHLNQSQDTVIPSIILHQGSTESRKNLFFKRHS